MAQVVEITRPQDDKPLVDIAHEAINEMKRLLAKQDDPEMGVRLGVRGGGCAGFSYDIRLDRPRDEKDRVWAMDGVRIIVDRKSLIFLAGSQLQYSNDLLMGGFKFVNPNASRTCGCGTSFGV